MRQPLAALVVVLAALSGACSSGASSHGSTTGTNTTGGGPTTAGPGTGWRTVPRAVLGPGVTRIVDTAPLSEGVIAVGSVTTDGKRVPAGWTSTDGTSWVRLSVVPKSPYGFESELTTVAATPDGRAAAIGQAVGGTHGNPRVGSWYLDGSTLREVVAGVELYGGPRQGSVDEMAAGPAGFLVVGSRTDRNEKTGAAVWRSPDAHDAFTILDTDPQLESAPGELVRAIGAAGSPSGYLAVGDRTVDGRLDDDAVAWTSPTGLRWTRVSGSPTAFGGPGAELAQLATSWGQGWAAAGTDTQDGKTSIVVWSSADGVEWHRTPLSSLGTDPDVLSEVTSLSEYGGRLYLGARLGSRYVAASSEDGLHWTTIALPTLGSDDRHARLLLLPSTGALTVAATTDEGTRLWTAT